MPTPTRCIRSFRALATASVLLAACSSGGGGKPADTDGDGLDDATEVAIGTSPLLADTDGDNLTDQEEHVGGGFDPLLADVPRMQIAFVGTVDVLLDESLSRNCSDSTRTVQATLDRQETNYSRTDARSTRQTVEASVEVSVTAKASLFPPKASAETTAKASASYSNVQEKSTTFTRGSATAAQQEYQQEASRSCFSGSETTGGIVTMGFQVSNTSNIAYTLQNLTMTVLQRRSSRDASAFTVLGTVSPLAAPVNLAPGAQTGALTIPVEVPASRALELLQNPAGLFFEVGTYDLVDEEGRNFAFIGETTLSRTALVVIDYADLRESERFLVATNVERDAAGDPVGVRMSRVMQLLGIPYQTEAGHTPDGTATTASVLASVRGISHDAATRQFWYVFGSPHGIADPALSFDDLRLQHGDVIHLVLLRDQDHDDIVDREELLLRTDPGVSDTDADGITDYDETKVGWVVSFGGTSRTVYSDPTSADLDQDGLDDPGERTHGTDPNDPDTDGDGILDGADTPLGGDPVKLGQLRVERRGTSIYVTGTVASDLPLAELTVAWGDGATYRPALAPDTRVLAMLGVHPYAAGTWTLTVTARDTAAPTPNVAVRRFEVGWAAPSTTPVMGYGAGWRVTEHVRTLADVNGDGKADLVGFASDGVYVALANGGGFGAMTRWVAGYGQADGWRVGVHRRLVVDVNRDGCADVVGFGGGGVTVSTSDCAGAFAAPAIWLAEFGSGAGWREDTHPLFVEDVTGDGYPDVVAISDRPHVAINTGTGFAPSFVGTQEFGSAVGGWSMASHPRLLADVDGDGRTDLVGFGGAAVYAGLGNGDGTFRSAVTLKEGFGVSTGWTTSRHPRMLADVDGDGDLDLVGFGGSVQVSLNQTPPGGVPAFGPLQVAITEFGSDQGWWAYDLSPAFPPIHPRFLVDMNGDGRADILGISSGATHVALANTDGTFAPAQIWFSGFGSEFWRERYPVPIVTLWVYWPRLVADATGDGRPDVIGFGPDGAVLAPNTVITELAPPLAPGP